MEKDSLLGLSVYRAFGKYVSLNIISMLGLSCYILADTFFIANGIGPDGLVALNLVLPVYSLLNALGLMLATGCGTYYAISLGRGEGQAGSRMFTLFFWLAAGVGLAFTAWGVFGSVPLVRFLGAEGKIIPLSAKYIQTLLCFAVAFMLNNLMVYMVRNDGGPKLAMAAMLTGCLANVLMDYLFIYPLQMGMFGAALATGCAPILGLLVNSLHLLKKRNRFHLCRQLGRLGAALKDLLKTAAVGVGAFITEFSSGIVIFLFNWAILGLAGEIGVAAYGIIANISLVFVAVFTGIGQGLQPLVSFYFGAGAKENIRKILRLALVLALALGVGLYALCFVGNAQIAGWFNQAGDAQLLALTAHGVRLYFLCIILMGINIVATSFFASIAKPREAFVISLLRGFVAILPAVWLLPKLWQLDGIWLAIPCAETLTCLLVAGLLLRQKKQDGLPAKTAA